jgi:hypothetical protein
LEGHSIRNLIGQVGLREIQSPQLDEVLRMNNAHAKQKGQYQYMVLPNGNSDPATYSSLLKLKDPKVFGKMSERQQINVQINLQLIEMEDARKEGMVNVNDGDDDASVFTDL